MRLWRLSSFALAALLLSGAGCKKHEQPGALAAKTDTNAAAQPPAEPVRTVVADDAPRLEQRPDKDQDEEVHPLALCDAQGKEVLQAARDYYDAANYEQALSCAAEACAISPDDPAAHSERANALAELKRYDEAKLAFARALALDPDLPDALLGASHLYTVALPGSRDHDELGLLYANRGLAAARKAKDDDLMVEFGTLSAMAFNDLGESKMALERADEVLKKRANNEEAAYERALALFELCRFRDAKEAFTRLLDDPERAAHAHEHLGLLLEREGKFKEAEEHFKAAQKARPEDFPPPIILSKDDFEQEMKKAISQLPKDMQKDIATVPIRAEDLPAEDDLIGNDPPLSPTILGLFRGPPLNEPCEPQDETDGEGCRSVALYRLNLGRAVTSKKELIEQIRVTLLHEIGHLRGEDDMELAARGLE